MPVTAGRCSNGTVMAKPWYLDWNAWTVLGTWAAVILALGLGFRDSWRQRRSDKAEARALARLIAAEIDRLGVAANELKKRMARYREPQPLAELLGPGHDRSLATECAPLVARLRSDASQNLLGRTHVLAPDVSDAVMRSLAEFSLARTLCEAVVEQSQELAPADVVLHIEGLIACADSCIEDAKVAAKACRRAIGE